MPTRMTASRIAATACGAALAFGATAVTASADETAPTEAPVPDAQMIGNDAEGLSVNTNIRGPVQTHLFKLQLADGTLFSTYCVELTVPVNGNSPGMTEVPWDAYPNSDSPFHHNRAHVNWILHNSYPAVKTVDVLPEDVATQLTDGLSVEEAIAATQAAIWHYSDNAALDEADATSGDEAADADVRMVYDYLTGDANVGIAAVDPELALKPAAGVGTAGQPIGPLTVSTTAASATVSADLPDGVTLTDADGNEVADTVTNGTELFVDVPADAEAGSGTIQLSASAQLSTGRLWIGVQNEDIPTQSLILAASDSTAVDVEGTVQWEAAPVEETPAPTQTPTPTETPDEELPDTGSSSMTWPLIAGVVLVAGGVGAVFLRRRSQ